MSAPITILLTLLSGISLLFFLLTLHSADKSIEGETRIILNVWKNFYRIWKRRLSPESLRSRRHRPERAEGVSERDLRRWTPRRCWLRIARRVSSNFKSGRTLPSSFSGPAEQVSLDGVRSVHTEDGQVFPRLVRGSAETSPLPDVKGGTTGTVHRCSLLSALGTPPRAL